MAEQGNRWSWDVAGFEPWKSPSPEQNDQKPTAPLARRNSTTSSVPPHSVASKVEGLREKVKVMRFHFHVYRVLLLSNSLAETEILVLSYFGESAYSGFCFRFGFICFVLDYFFLANFSDC